MKDITTRLETSAKWVEDHARYNFTENPNHHAMRLSTDAVRDMKDAAELIRELRDEINILQRWRGFLES